MSAERSKSLVCPKCLAKILVCRDKNGTVHAWKCTNCGATGSLNFPENQLTVWT